MTLPAAAHYDFERDVVQILLKAWNLSDHIVPLKSRHRLRYGESRLSLEAFHAEFQDFPMLFAARYVGWTKRSFTMTTAFKNFFGMTPLLNEYQDLANRGRHRPGGHFGFVFHQAYLGSGANGLVLHNRPIDVSIAGTRMLAIAPNGEQLVIEPLAVLLKDLKREWPKRKSPGKAPRFSCKPTAEN